MDLARAWTLAEEETRAQNALWAGVKEGMSPFRPHPVNILMDFDLDFNTYRLLVEFPSLRQSFKTHMDRDLLLDDPNELFSNTADRVFNMIRYRATEPVPNNIELGEN